MYIHIDMSKRFFYLFSFFIVPWFLSGCSTNPATGEDQFTAFMSPQDENDIGAEEHKKVIKEFGLYQDQALQSYVDEIGQKVLRGTERDDVLYRFYILDTPVVNAFALPGGYIYVTRGLLSLANSEAEIAAVIAHETAHITARHSAERYSRGIVTALGAVILTAAAGGGDDVFEAVGKGSALYLNSYSRGQESQADEIGMRYLHRAGYDVHGMPIFLSFMQAEQNLDDVIAKRKEEGKDFFATHPATKERVDHTLGMVGQYPSGGVIGKERFVRALDGMLYGDSPEQGLVRGNVFIHPVLGLRFTVPPQFHMMNFPDKVVAESPAGAVIIFDLKPAPKGFGGLRRVLEKWVKQDRMDVRHINVNGFDAVMTKVSGEVDGRQATLRMYVIGVDETYYARFMVATPDVNLFEKGDQLKDFINSFERVSEAESRLYQPYRLSVVMAQSGDTVQSMAGRMVLKDGYSVQRFKILNGISDGDQVIAGQFYKLITY